MEPIIIDENGKKVFVGQEDPSNPPVFVKNPNARYCPKCHKESDNTKVYCDYCQTPFDDGKMQCPLCLKFFDYLVGEDINGGKRGCESCWKPPVKQEERETHEQVTGEVFD
jgi:hypothetical protein